MRDVQLHRLNNVCILNNKQNVFTWESNKKKSTPLGREYSTYRVVPTSRLKALRHLVVLSGCP